MTKDSLPKLGDLYREFPVLKSFLQKYDLCPYFCEVFPSCRGLFALGSDLAFRILIEDYQRVKCISLHLPTNECLTLGDYMEMIWFVEGPMPSQDALIAFVEYYRGKIVEYRRLKVEDPEYKDPDEWPAGCKTYTPA